MASYYESDQSRLSLEPKWAPAVNVLEIPLDLTIEQSIARVEDTKIEIMDECGIGEKIQLIAWVAHVRDMALRKATANGSITDQVHKDPDVRTCTQTYIALVEHFLRTENKAEVRVWLESEQSSDQGQTYPM